MFANVEYGNYGFVHLDTTNVVCAPTKTHLVIKTHHVKGPTSNIRSHTFGRIKSRNGSYGAKFFFPAVFKSRLLQLGRLTSFSAFFSNVCCGGFDSENIHEVKI